MLKTADKCGKAILADHLLAENASNGSAAAFAQLVARHCDAVYTIVSNMCGASDDAQEAVEDAFGTAWRDLRTYPAGARFTTWLYRIAMKTALARRARDGRRHTSRVLEAFMPAFDEAGALIACDGRWPELDGRSPQRIDITAPLQDALEGIDDQTLAAFTLCDLVELRTEEAAVILDLSPRAVRCLAHRARLILRGLIDRLSTPSVTSFARQPV